MTSMIKYGGIYLANLNPQPKKCQTEMSKTRPVLVLQNKALLEQEHPSTIILPLSTNLAGPSNLLRVRIRPQGKLEKESEIVLDQIRTIDNSHFVDSGPLCVISKQMMSKVHEQLKLILDID